MNTRLVRIGTLDLELFGKHGSYIVDQNFSAGKNLPGYQRTALVVGDDLKLEVVAVVDAGPVNAFEELRGQVVASWAEYQRDKARGLYD